MDGNMACERHGRGWRRRFDRNRPRRVLLLLAAVWIVQGFDLGFTIVAHQWGTLAELNPAGNWALQRGPLGAILFKTSLVLLGSVILWCCRTRVLSECLLWLVVSACVGLSLRWQDYFSYFLENPHTIAVVHPDGAPVETGPLWVERCRKQSVPQKEGEASADRGAEGLTHTGASDATMD